MRAIAPLIIMALVPTRPLFPAVTLAAPPRVAVQPSGQSAMDLRRGENCTDGQPGFIVRVDGLRDRTGRLFAELYPATAEDFLKGADALFHEGKPFRRIIMLPAQRGPVSLCIDAPATGPFALVVIHDRDGKAKFDLWSDGVAVVGNQHLGRRKPLVTEATVNASRDRHPVQVRMQYMRGLSGFAPIG